MAARKPWQRRDQQHRDQQHWLVSGLLFVAIGVAASGMGSVLKDVAWWFMFMAVTAVVLLAAAILRSVARHRIWSSVAGFGAGVASMTLLFAPGTALLGFIPTFATFEAFHELEVAGTASIAGQDVPANADSGILYLLCLGAAGIAFATDTIAHQFRSPALAGVPLLVLVLVPSFVRSEFSNGFVFALTALAWLAMLLTPTRRVAVGTAATAVIAALLLPIVLPPVQPGSSAASPDGVATGLNPIITLGNDLRRADPTLALTYQTTSPDGQYLRLTALDDFAGVSWAPTIPEIPTVNDIEEIGPVPGLGEGVPTTPAVTEITVANILSRWLPVPYAAVSVVGVDGQWSWEPDGLTIRTESSNARNQEYEVESTQVAPSIEQLVAAGTTVEPGFERYLALPPDLPPVVGTTAIEVVAAAATNYDKAIALQAYFRGGTFEYSQDAPVEQDYDGSGAAVLGEFLEARAGYCVHFSSAMAAMARTLGIPSRVVVGFTPGAAVTPQGVPEGAAPLEYRVSTDNLHAWPELYFSGIGWIRFEPTPGRGFEPAFAPLSQDDPSTPDVDESVPAPAATAAVAPTAAPTGIPDDPALVDDNAGAGDAVASAPVVVWPFLVALLLALLVTPWAVRAFRRRQRLAAARSGSARAAWDELRAHVTDLGLPVGTVNRTPRQLADDLGGYLDDGERDALTRLTAAIETESFAGLAPALSVSDLVTVSRGLRRGAGLGAAALAALLPRSLVLQWLPSRQLVE